MAITASYGRYGQRAARLGPDGICLTRLPASVSVPFFQRRHGSYCAKPTRIWCGWPGQGLAKLLWSGRKQAGVQQSSGPVSGRTQSDPACLLGLHSAFGTSTEVVYLHRCFVVTWLVPRGTAPISAHVLCTPYDHTPGCDVVRSHKSRMHVAVTAITFGRMTGMFDVLLR